MRSKPKKQFTVLFSEHIRDQVFAAAKSEGVSVSKWIRDLVKKEMKSLGFPEEDEQP